MSAEDIQYLITVAKDVGFPLLSGVFALIIMLMLARSYFKKADSTTDMGLSAHKEMIRLREHELGVIDDRLELEKKYTACEKERTRLEGYILLIESKQQTAVEEYLDDTHNFNKDLDIKDKELLKLTGKLADAETKIAAKDEVIAAQNTTIAEQATTIATLLANTKSE